MALSLRVGSNHLGNPQADPFVVRTLGPTVRDIVTHEIDLERALGRDIRNLAPHVWRDEYEAVLQPFSHVVRVVDARRPETFVRHGGLAPAAALCWRLDVGHALLAAVTDPALLLSVQMFVDMHIFMYIFMTERMPAMTWDALRAHAREYYAAYPTTARAFSMGRMTDLSNVLIKSSKLWHAARAPRHPFVLGIMQALLDKSMLQPCVRRGIVRMLVNTSSKYHEVHDMFLDIVLVVLLGNYLAAPVRPPWAARVRIVKEMHALARIGVGAFAALITRGDKARERRMSVVIAQFMRIYLCHTIDSHVGVRAIEVARHGYATWSRDMVYDCMTPVYALVERWCAAPGTLDVIDQAHLIIFPMDGQRRRYIERRLTLSFAARVAYSMRRFFELISNVSKFGGEEVSRRLRYAEEILVNGNYGRVLWNDMLKQVQRYFPDLHFPLEPGRVYDLFNSPKVSSEDVAHARDLGRISARSPSGVPDFAQLYLLGVSHKSVLALIEIFDEQMVRCESRNRIPIFFRSLFDNERDICIIYHWLCAIAMAETVTFVPMTRRVAACQTASLRRKFCIPPDEPVPPELGEIVFCENCGTVYSYVGGYASPPMDHLPSKDSPNFDDLKTIWDRWEDNQVLTTQIMGLRRGRMRVARFDVHMGALVCGKRNSQWCGALRRESIIGRTVFIRGAGFALCSHGHIMQCSHAGPRFSHVGERGPVCGLHEREPADRPEPASIGLRSNTAEMAFLRALNRTVPPRHREPPRGSCALCNNPVGHAQPPLGVMQDGVPATVVYCEMHRPIAERVYRGVGATRVGALPDLDVLHARLILMSRAAKNGSGIS